MSYEYKYGLDVLLCAQNQREEEILFNRWIHLMSDMSFDEFKAKIGYRPRKHEEDKNADDILDDVRKIMGGLTHGNI